MFAVATCKSMGSTTLQGFRDPARSDSALEVQPFGRGPSVRVKKAIQVVLAAIALDLTHALLQQFLIMRHIYVFSNLALSGNIIITLVTQI